MLKFADCSHSDFISLNQKYADQLISSGFIILVFLLLMGSVIFINMPSAA